MPIDLNSLGKGCLPQPKDRRDFRLELVAGAEPLPKEYSLRDKVFWVKNQNGSGSCVAQAFSSNAEIINKIETSQNVKLSARDIYSLIFYPEGGAYLRDACKKLCDSGVATESNVPSYEQGNPPSESFMRKRDGITPEAQEEGMTYWAGSYCTWDNGKFEMYKKAILKGTGCVIGAFGSNYIWQNSILQVPESKEQCTWAHAVFATGWKIIGGKEYLEFLNSWGENWGDRGFGYMPKEYIDKGYVFNVWTIIDRPNDTYPKIKHQIFLIQEAIKKIGEGIKSLLKGRKLTIK